MEELRASDPLNSTWTMLVLLVAVALLGWVNLVSPRKWRLLERSFFTLRLGRQSLRDELDIQDRTLLGLVIAACGVVGLFASQCAALWAGLEPGFGLWAQCFGLASGVLVLQVLALRVVGLLFQGDGGLTEHMYTVLVLWVGGGLALLPVTVVIAFPHQPAWRFWLAAAGAVILAVITLFRWARAALVGLGEGVPLRYIFIYLCALEILPLALALQQFRASVHLPFNL